MCAGEYSDSTQIFHAEQCTILGLCMILVTELTEETSFQLLM